MKVSKSPGLQFAMALACLSVSASMSAHASTASSVHAHASTASSVHAHASTAQSVHSQVPAAPFVSSQVPAAQFVDSQDSTLHSAAPTQHSLIAQAKPTAPAVNKKPDPKKSCRHFVQEFYNFYVPITGDKPPSAPDALEKRKSDFSEDLYKQLKADFDAQDKEPDEIVGLDFDPFLNGQDFAEKYIAGEVIERAGRFFVDVHSMSQGKKSEKPQVVPELTRRNGKWVFLNFHYGKTSIPENENLISILKALKNDRSKNK